MKTIVTVLAAAVVFLAAAASPAWAQKPPDKKKPQPARKTPKDVVIHSNGEAEGKILAESWKEIIVDLGGGRQEKVPASEVELVVYADAPDAYRGALERVGADDYASALISLGSAKEWVEKNKVGGWFDAYFTYYRGYCLAKQNKHVPAINELKDYLAKHGPRYHMTRKALEMCFDALKATKDVEKAKEIGAIPLPPEIKPLSDYKRAEFLRAAGSPRDAIPICEELRVCPDTDIRNRAVVLQMDCLKDLKDQAGLEKLCDEITKTSTNRAALFVAKAAMGEAAFKAGQILKAVTILTEALVIHHATGVEAAHEEALWTLGQAYEKLAGGQSDALGKRQFLFMASGAYNELVTSHRKGTRTPEAEKKAEEIDKQVEVLDKAAEQKK